MRSSRSLRRHAAVAGSTCLLLAAAVACGPAEGATTPASTVRDAVDQLTAEESATVIGSVDAPVSEVRELLREFGQDGGRRQAQRVARAEISVAMEADGPLNELEKYGPQTRLALALCLGDRDVVAYKSVGERIYLRLQLKELARQGSLTPEQRKRVKDLVGIADELPKSLHAAKRLLTGGWVRIDPETFADYGWAVEEFTGLPLDAGDVRGAGTVLDGSELRATLSGLEDVLTEHGTYRKTGGGAGGDVAEEEGTQRMRVELPARRTAKALAPLLRPLGAELTPRDVPGRRVSAELVIRRGSLAEITFDLGALTEGGSAQVPLRLRFSPGDVFSPNPPKKSVHLKPQDLLAAVLYGAARSPSY